MARDFSFFEDGIRRIAGQLPGMPQDRVVLNRLFFCVFRELDDVYNQHLARHGLNTSSFLALAMLLGRPDNRLNPGDLSEVLIASRTNVTRLVNDLVAAGWVTRAVSEADRRKVDLSLTASGRERMRVLMPEMWQLVERQWHDFSADEMAILGRLLRRMLQALAGRDLSEAA